MRPSPYIEAVELVDRPLIPSEYDQEFDRDTLYNGWTLGGTTWTPYNPLSVNNSTPAIDPYAAFTNPGNDSRFSLNSMRPSWFMAQNAVGIGGHGVVLDLTPPADFFIWSRQSFMIRRAGQALSDSVVSLEMKDSGSTDQIYILLNSTATVNNANIHCRRNIGGVFASVANTNNVGGTTTIYGQTGHTVGIQRIGTTYYFWVQSQTGEWLYLGSTSAVMTVNQIRVGFGTTATTTPGNAVGGVDYVRYRAGKFLP